MSDFATAFADIMRGGEESKDARIQRSQAMYGHSEVDARIIDEVVQRGVIEAARAVGAALDSITPRLVADMMPMMLYRAACNMESLEEEVIKVVFGVSLPTPGCDCMACKNVEFLRDQLRTAEQACVQAQQEHEQ